MDELNKKPRIKIEISGPAKSGKSTVAQVLVKELESIGGVEYNDDGPLFTESELEKRVESLRDKVEFEISTKVVRR